MNTPVGVSNWSFDASHRDIDRSSDVCVIKCWSWFGWQGIPLRARFACSRPLALKRRGGGTGWGGWQGDHKGSPLRVGFSNHRRIDRGLRVRFGG